MNYAGSPSHSPATLWFYTVVFTSMVPRPAASALPGNLCKKYRFLYPTPGCVHAKLLQSCPTLCKPVDHSLPGSSVHGILQARILDWFAIPSSEDLPDPGMEPESPMSPALAGRFLTTAPLGKPHPRPADSETPWWGPEVLCFNKMIHMPLILENHCLLTSLLEHNWEWKRKLNIKKHI